MTIFVLALVQHIFIAYPGTLETISLSDAVLGQSTMAILLALSYGQSFLMSYLKGSYSQIYFALIKGEEYAVSTWFSVYSHVNWLFWMVLATAVLAKRWKENGLVTSVSNHLLLQNCQLATLAIGSLLVLIRIASYDHISMSIYAQCICHHLLLFSCLVILNHRECREFALRKIKLLPVISHLTLACGRLAACSGINTLGGNRVSPINVIV